MSKQAPAAIDADARGLAIGIAAARFNAGFVDALLGRCLETLETSGVRPPVVVRVPGSNELPIALQSLAAAGDFDALIALGVLIRGETIHFQVIADCVSHALQTVALGTHLPVINGVLTVENEAQAQARCGGAADRGAEFARAAIEMGLLVRRIGKSRPHGAAGSKSAVPRTMRRRA